MGIIEITIVAVLVLIAGAYIVYALVRTMQGKGGCGCGTDACPKSTDQREERP